MNRLKSVQQETGLGMGQLAPNRAALGGAARERDTRESSQLPTALSNLMARNNQLVSDDLDGGVAELNSLYAGTPEWLPSRLSAHCLQPGRCSLSLRLYAQYAFVPKVFRWPWQKMLLKPSRKGGSKRFDKLQLTRMIHTKHSGARYQKRSRQHVHRRPQVRRVQSASGAPSPNADTTYPTKNSHTCPEA